MNTEPIVIKREQVTFAVDAQLSVPGANDKVGPIEHVGYSRFVLTIVDKKGEHVVYPTGNIPQSDIAGIYHRKNGIVQARTIYEMLAPTSGNGPSGGDVLIPFGTHKGKSVKELCVSDPEEAKKQLSFYESNLAKYPANQKIVDAFHRALSSPADASATAVPAFSFSLKPVTVYEAKMKFLRSRADDKGNVFVYSISMRYEPEMRYPYIVEISNGYAPISSTATGGFNIEASKMINKVTSSIRLTAAEFEETVDKLYSVSLSFDISMFPGQYRKAKKMAAADAKIDPVVYQKSEASFVPDSILKNEESFAMLDEDLQAALHSKN